MIDWGEPDYTLTPIEQLHAEAELLRLVAYWREKYEALAYEKMYRIRRWQREKRLAEGVAKG